MGPLSSSPPSKATGQSCISSPSLSAGGRSFNSSPQGPISASNNSNTREHPMIHPNQARLSNKCSLGEESVREKQIVDVGRVTSWSQYLDISGEAHIETAHGKHTVDMSQLFLGQKFACGAYSRLYHGQYKGKEVAVKMVLQPDDDNEIANRLDRQFGQEVSLLSRLHHVNIVEFVGAMRKPPVFCIIMEYLEGGSLKAFLHKTHPRSLPLDKVLAFALDIARGMEYLHSQGVLHLDLKSSNLVLADNWRIKVTDFGVARLECECASMTPDSGTYRWMAPEMISNKTFSVKADVFGFGIILWELITGQTPYDDMSTIQAAFAVVHKNLRPPIPDKCPHPLKQLMEECWTANPDKRPSFWQIVQRLEEFQGCLARNENLHPCKFDCKKRSWFEPILQKFKPICFTSN